MACASAELSAFLSRLIRSCLDIRAVWCVGHAELEPATIHECHELLVFADAPALDTLRRNNHLHRTNVQLLVVFDGDRFENPWGPHRRTGSLARWAWRQEAPDVAYYDESRWADREADPSAVVRIRRKAFLIWPSPTSPE